MLEFLPKVPIIRPTGVPLQCATERCSHTLYCQRRRPLLVLSMTPEARLSRCGGGDKDRGGERILMKALSDAFLWREHPIHPTEPYKSPPFPPYSVLFDGRA